MSLIKGRINDLIRDAQHEINTEEASEIAGVIRCTGRYGAEAMEVVMDVLAAMRVLAGPDGDNARYLSRSTR